MENMNREEILAKVDHTLLKQDASWEQIRELCDDAMRYHTASVCIPPYYIREAAGYVEGKMKICTVIGFPNGYHTTKTKVFETENAVGDGADEIDMVINIASLKSGRVREVEEEIDRIRKAAKQKILKVIIETCLLTREEKLLMCSLVTECGADFIKTSTGFSICGATFDDVKLLAENVGPMVKVKATGGISSFEDAQKFIELGADRLGTSRLVQIAKKEDATA